MKTRVWQKMAVIAALLTATAVGQSKRGEQILHVPFPFVVANKTLPSGRYVVTNVGETLLRIDGVDRNRAIVQTHGVQGRSPESLGKMVFHKYGSVYFLSEVWTPGESIGQELATSRFENELSASGPGAQPAVLTIAAVGR